MSVKKIYLNNDISLIDWINQNKSIIVETLYDNVFDFCESNAEAKLVLKVEHKPKMNMINMESYGMVFDFMLIREDILITLNSLLEYYEETEEYEKCLKLINLKKSLEK